MAFLYTTHEPEMDLGTVEPFEMNVKMEQRSDFDVDNVGNCSLMPKKLKR